MTVTLYLTEIEELDEECRPELYPPPEAIALTKDVINSMISEKNKSTRKEKIEIRLISLDFTLTWS